MIDFRRECLDFVAKALKRGLTRAQVDKLWAEYKLAQGYDPGAMTATTGPIFNHDKKSVDDFLETRAPQKRAKSSRIFPKGKIENEILKSLVYYLDYNRDGQTEDIDIARRFCEENNLAKNQPQSLLSQVRKLRIEGRVRI